MFDKRKMERLLGVSIVKVTPVGQINESADETARLVFETGTRVLTTVEDVVRYVCETADGGFMASGDSHAVILAGGDVRVVDMDATESAPPTATHKVLIPGEEPQFYNSFSEAKGACRKKGKKGSKIVAMDNEEESFDYDGEQFVLRESVNEGKLMKADYQRIVDILALVKNRTLRQQLADAFAEWLPDTNPSFNDKMFIQKVMQAQSDEDDSTSDEGRLMALQAFVDEFVDLPTVSRGDRALIVAYDEAVKAKDYAKAMETVEAMLDVHDDDLKETVLNEFTTFKKMKSSTYRKMMKSRRIQTPAERRMNRKRRLKYRARKSTIIRKKNLWKKRTANKQHQHINGLGKRRMAASIGMESIEMPHDLALSFVEDFSKLFGIAPMTRSQTAGVTYVYVPEALADAFFDYVEIDEDDKAALFMEDLVGNPARGKEGKLKLTFIVGALTGCTGIEEGKKDDEDSEDEDEPFDDEEGTCPDCGSELNDDGTCPECDGDDEDDDEEDTPKGKKGKKDEASDDDAEDTVACPECGSEMPKDGTCPECGYSEESGDSGVDATDESYRLKGTPDKTVGIYRLFLQDDGSVKVDRPNGSVVSVDSDGEDSTGQIPDNVLKACAVLQDNAEDDTDETVFVSSSRLREFIDLVKKAGADTKTVQVEHSQGGVTVHMVGKVAAKIKPFCKGDGITFRA